MNTNDLTPFERSHPGELLRHELESRNLTQAQFARLIGTNPTWLNEIVKTKRGVNTEMALILEASLGIPASIWLDLQRAYNMQIVQAKDSFMERLASIRKKVAEL